MVQRLPSVGTNLQLVPLVLAKGLSSAGLPHSSATPVDELKLQALAELQAWFANYPEGRRREPATMYAYWNLLKEQKRFEEFLADASRPAGRPLSYL